MRTLRSRLNRGLTVILVLVFCCQWFMLSLAIRKVAEDQMLKHLEHDGDSVFAALSIDGAGRLQVDKASLEAVYSEPLSGHYLVIHVGETLAFRSPSHADGSLPVSPLKKGGRLKYHATGPGDQPVLALTRGFPLGGVPITITVAEDLTDMKEEIGTLSLASLAVILPLLVAAVMVQNLGIRQALEPLAGIREELSKIERGEGARIDGEVPGEIRPLVDEVNRLLVLVERRLQQSRTAVGNLAHALKTPLAVLFHLADDPATPPALARQLQAQTGFIRDRIERELKRARLAGTGGAGASLNPREELEGLTQVLQTVYRDKNLKIPIDAPDALLPYDREDVLELLGNLADNACKWATREVRIAVAEGAEDGGLLLLVADDGPGCSPEEIRRLAQRGLRLDESKSGHGLGLAIAQDIVNFYGGTLTFDRDPGLGGLRVQARLPRDKPGA